MSEDAQSPDAPGNGSEVDLTKRGGPGAQGASGGTPAAPNPWAPPASESDGPGSTTASNAPQSWPAPSVHDQPTITSMPGTGAAPGGPWAGPGAPGGPASPATPNASPAGPFAPPSGPVPPNAPSGGPFAPPVPPNASSPDPFAPPAPYPHPHPHAHSHGEPVPPPPIAPDGPGPVPYGYPGGYGYPPQAGYGGYAWPGAQPPPSNGMGTAALVLGIISAAVFCLWPVAILLGVLALVFGLIGRGKAQRHEATNPGQALAGVICGAVGIVLGLVMMVVVIVT
ncbi:DUF4190 domain-containing protein [Streptomyces sp. TRM68416]|uniref:DUF4190 domain-containing protein n=1 Tax=Streptomyces sp. TRM68416 TaxID=2758412 RepID=UPI001CB73630|nr:DUF4190 domain-containing protein [Streptomyces sp. TRM68416]